MCHFRLECDSFTPGDCEAVAAARMAFSFMLDPLENALRKSMTNIGGRYGIRDAQLIGLSG